MKIENPSPPRCLLQVMPSLSGEPVRARLLDIFDPESSSVRAELAVWNLRCPCGCDEGMVVGVRKDDVYVPPVRLVCARCNASSVFFDPTVDGWNAEVRRKPKRSKAQPIGTYAWHCRSCKKTKFRPAVLVTYQGDNYEGIPKERWQDFFDVICVGGECVGCGRADFVVSHECA